MRKLKGLTSTDNAALLQNFNRGVLQKVSSPRRQEVLYTLNIVNCSQMGSSTIHYRIMAHDLYMALTLAVRLQMLTFLFYSVLSVGSTHQCLLLAII